MIESLHSHSCRVMNAMSMNVRHFPVNDNVVALMYVTFMTWMHINVKKIKKKYWDNDILFYIT